VRGRTSDIPRPLRRTILPGIVLAVALGVLLPSPLSGFGGAWVKGPGGYYFRVGFSSTTAGSERGFQGEERPLYRDTLRIARGSIGISNFSIYNEFGWNDWLTSQVSARYTVVVREADLVERGMEGERINESASGIGDVDLGLRLRLPVPVSGMAAALNLGWKVPLAPATTEIPLGTGAADYDAGLALGYSFPVLDDAWGFVQTAGAWRLRNGAADEFVWRLQGGVPIISTLSAELQLDGVHSTANFDDAVEGDDPLSLNRMVGSQSYLHFSTALTYRLNDWTDLQARYTTTIAGRNTLDAQTIGVGVAWKGVRN